MPSGPPDVRSWGWSRPCPVVRRCRLLTQRGHLRFLTFAACKAAKLRTSMRRFFAGHSMRRREFMLAVCGATLTWSFAANAQQVAKVPTIGFLGQLSQSAKSKWTAAFVGRLRELGWVEGRTVAIEYRWGEGRNERFAEAAHEFVRLKLDVIVTGGTAAIMAAKQATSVVPIVFAVAGDPVGTGLVGSLARPGSNLTGLSNLSA